MPNKMLVDATHPEETRVVVLRGNRVEEFDYESANRKQLRGNIYLAKVTRVEPSLQAAFVEYGGNRHGFLAFSEIHPDYYQIPTADRQALLEDEARAHRDEEDEHERRSSRRRGRHRDRGARRRQDTVRSAPVTGDEAAAAPDQTQPAAALDIPSAGDLPGESFATAENLAGAENFAAAASGEAPQGGLEAAPAVPQSAESDLPAGDAAAGEAPAPAGAVEATAAEPETSDDSDHTPVLSEESHAEDDANGDDEEDEGSDDNGEDENGEDDAVEVVGGADALEEAAPPRPRHRRQYKIQEVIKRRQVMLVQVVKEERGSKGAALTTYLSLAGRYSVLMPNTARGGGISRKITSAEDRRRMKEMVEELQVPEGMGIILRTAGQNRTKTEIKRDFEYLLRVWEQVRDLTLKSTAPTLVYEEGSLTKRSIRDLYNKDIDEIIVAGERGYRDAKEFMRMLMPSHAKNVKLYRDSQPIFTRYGIESQLDAMFSPTVQLKSGGYIVINQTEALVAIDVNSGRATREHHIEDTALKTNLEAADEVARQLRLRDLAGLIVIDFIDMDESRNNRQVERRLKEALKHDRARIQVGRISHFGLMEMSRQRIRTSVLESSTEKCPYCGGSGHVRSVSSVTLQLLRALEEHLLKGAMHNLVVRTRTEVALYILNHKRAHLRALEERFEISIVINADPNFSGQMSFEIIRGEQVHTLEAAKAIAARSAESLPPLTDEDDALIDAEYAEAEAEAMAREHGEAAEDGHAAEAAGVDGEDAEAGEAQEGGRRRRRRRGRRGRDRAGDDIAAAPPDEIADEAASEDEFSEAAADGLSAEASDAANAEHQNGDREGAPRRRRRGRRGGRRNRERREGRPELHEDAAAIEMVEQSAAMTPQEPDFFSAAPPPPAPAAEAPVEPAADRTPAEPSFTAEPVLPPPSPPSPAPRRRSTVREPAPGLAAAPPPPAPAPAPAPMPQPAPDTSAAPPEPAASSDQAPAQPKRGWWGRRLLGN